jgi:glycosyltransferase involved in cell wall biosynthesis
LKIAYLFENFPSATETFLAREVEALRDHGFEIEVWALEAGPGALKIPAPPRALKLAGRESYRRVQGALLATQLRQHEVQHVHATWANHIADLACFAAQKAALSWSFAAHARDLWVDGGDLKAKLASAQFAATCTRAGEKELRRYGDNVLYAPHGLPLNQYEFAEWSGGEMRLMGVGRLIEKKGWLDLIEAVSQLKEQGNQVTAQIIGEGPLQAELEKRIRALDLVEQIQLSGALTHEAVMAAMKRAHCFVLPSRIARDGDRDGLANVLLEAGALGLPLVTTDAGAARDFVDETTGRIAAPGDVSGLTAAINHVFTAPEETRHRCVLARQRIEREFDVEKNVAVLGKSFRASAG